MNPTAEHRKIGPVLATFMVTGAMIGSGVFMLPASLAAIGSVTALGWIATTLGALVLAAVFARLAVLRPHRVGLFSNVLDAFGPGTAFVAATAYWMSSWVGNAAIAVAVTGYLGFFMPALAAPPVGNLVAIGLVWLFLAATLVGPRFVASFAGGTLLIGVIPVLLVAVGGWLLFDPKIFAASWNVSGQGTLPAVAGSMVSIFWAFTGMECGSVVASVVRNPGRNVAIATLTAVGIAATLYMLACVAIMGMIPADTLARSTAPFADAVAPFFGVVAGSLVALCAMLKTLGTLGGITLATLETVESESLAGQLRRPGGVRAIGRAIGRASTGNILVTGVVTTLTILASSSATLAKQYTLAIDVSVILIVVVYVAACGALWRAAGKEPTRQGRTDRIIAALAALFSLGMIAAAEPAVLVWSGVLVAAAFLAYAVLRLRRLRLVRAGAAGG
ncbi:MAG TPA: amino acid permease [Stellaceae bacterium]|nr:amino acid permease [Stellaceae bacterium]